MNNIDVKRILNMLDNYDKIADKRCQDLQERIEALGLRPQATLWLVDGVDSIERLRTLTLHSICCTLINNEE